MNDKTIEEMADILCQSKNYKCDGEDCKCIKQATDLYNADYRNCKDKVVLTKQEYERLCDLAYFGSGEETIRKETAREILKELICTPHEYYERKIKVLAKQYGVELV